MAIPLMFIAYFVAFGYSRVDGSKKFLQDDSKYHTSKINSTAFRNEVMVAMDSMLGCGGQAKPHHVARIKHKLAPMWHTLPKRTYFNRIDRRSLRYLIHRYFMRTSSLSIRGFEPTRPVNESHWGVADILSQVVPAYVESVLESHHVKRNGFSLDDAVAMVVMLEQLIFDSESTLLQKVYDGQRKPSDRLLSNSGLQQVLEQYMIEWMVEGNDKEIEALISNRSLMHEVVPHFHQLMRFIEGRIKTLQFAHDRHTPQHRGKANFERRFSFEDAHEIVGGITRSFQSYWQSECNAMKLSLVTMDLQKTGRVPLSKFYGTAIDTDWRFSESEAYLRELGALDESSNWAGPQVIIPNYIQATSNCIVSTPHYLVCCINECESLLGEIEDEIGSPVATPSVLLPLVGNMTSQTTVDDDDSPLLEGALTEQLEQIAKTHGGRVPLHGRLFAQWLHYVFPRECPFPHKMGMVSAVTPNQYGDDYIASETDMRNHAANATAATLPIKVQKAEMAWMSQWSPEEEFNVDYSSEFGVSWERRLLLASGGLILLAFGISGGVVGRSSKATRASSHWV